MNWLRMTRQARLARQLGCLWKVPANRAARSGIRAGNLVLEREDGKDTEKSGLSEPACTFVRLLWAGQEGLVWIEQEFVGSEWR